MTKVELLNRVTEKISKNGTFDVVRSIKKNFNSGPYNVAVTETV